MNIVETQARLSDILIESDLRKNIFLVLIR
jgi:hypothetical protein